MSPTGPVIRQSGSHEGSRCWSGERPKELADRAVGSNAPGFCLIVGQARGEQENLEFYWRFCNVFFKI